MVGELGQRSCATTDDFNKAYMEIMLDLQHRYCKNATTFN